MPPSIRSSVMLKPIDCVKDDVSELQKEVALLKNELKKINLLLSEKVKIKEKLVEGWWWY